MAQPDIVAMRQRLDDFAHRLQTRSDEFQRTGEFSDAHRALLQRLRQRHNLLAEKVAEAEREGDAAGILEASLRRDVDTLFEGLHEFEERVHAEAVKHRSREQGSKS